MNSIQRELTKQLVAWLYVLWVVGSIAIFSVVRVGLIAEFDRTLNSKAQALAALFSQKDGVMEFDSSPAIQKNLLGDYFRIWWPGGGTGNVELVKQIGSFDLKLPDGKGGRAAGIAFVPVEDEESTRPAHLELTLVVAAHRDALNRQLRLVATALIVVGIAIIAATLYAVAFAVRRGLMPLAALGERAASINADSLALRFPADPMPAELQPIAGKLNELLARLEAAFARERQFSADVAHELRTPIAELRSLAEVALKWPDDAPATKRALEDAHAIALQMESIATTLLALARCESGQLPVTREPVALAPLLRDVAGKRPIALDVPADATWNTDRELLRVILSNLISNAVEYGTSARLRVAGDRLSVSNATENLTGEDVPRLFERFWRKDAARSSSNHAGLGLALSKAYAAALGLELRAELNDRILRFELSPAAVSLRAR